MTTLPNYQTREELSFARPERAAKREKPTTLVNAELVAARAQGVHDQMIQQSRLLSAVCFFVATGLAVWQISTTFMIVFLALAVIVSVTSRILALRAFREEIERTARAQGLAEDAVQRVATARTAAFRAKGANGEDALDAET
ncbi:hypothetical protein [Polyangium sp. y55x31]|uniref:hypothetical protein n=1 Tax=Polyangium sp. y55x31 TaxID=3042688 RepID=UPI00248314EB|nr:hypothetical protein [Polyangium sp. y55x31]MDI1475155.1 hypothetical protein [Polyangium sp. y55x31]